MKTKLFTVCNQPHRVDIALMVLRLVIGLAFIIHGYGKIQNPFGWAGPSSIPSLLQGLAALAEFGGGIALVIGLVFPLAVFGIACTMTVATCMHAFVFGDPFVNLTGGGSFEPALVYLAVMLLLLTTGPGRYSLDRKIFGTK